MPSMVRTAQQPNVQKQTPFKIRNQRLVRQVEREAKTRELASQCAGRVVAASNAAALKDTGPSIWHTDEQGRLLFQPSCGSAAARCAPCGSRQKVAELPASQSPLRDRNVLRDVTNESADRQGGTATQLPMFLVDELWGPAAAAMRSKNIAALGRHGNDGDGASVAIVPTWRLATMVGGHGDESDDDWL